MSTDELRTRGLFITGTDTGVGKTYVTALLARQLSARGRRVGAYKPACSGAEFDADRHPVWQDVEELSRAIGGGDIDRISPQRFQAALAPPVAADCEGKRVDARLLRSGARWWRGKVEILLIEGVGGLLCPLSDVETVADFASDIGYPLVVVARLGLGTINHTLLTLEAARRRRLKVAGIVLNEGLIPVDELEARTNIVEISSRCDAPLLAVLRTEGERLTPREGTGEVDWSSLATEGVGAHS